MLPSIFVLAVDGVWFWRADLKVCPNHGSKVDVPGGADPGTHKCLASIQMASDEKEHFWQDKG